MSVPGKKRLAIVGAGSSGLVSLKHALDELPDWDITCLEASGDVIGCWGTPYPGFVSTSTKYTTQFACFPKFDASVDPDGGASRAEFFRDSEYGQYLRQFAEQFNLRDSITFHRRVTNVRRDTSTGGWQVTHCDAREEGPTASETYDALILCTSLAAQAKAIDCDAPTLDASQVNAPGGLEQITGKRIVVVGGGEMAVDYANRLARPELDNKVYLSLRSGIRVSPRYHPIRGVPSDFLRNRLLLSIHPDLRNWIGQRFVEARIRRQESFERWFPPRQSKTDAGLSQQQQAKKKQWAHLLTATAKDDLFNMFHNKSDDFLNAVAQDRIAIIGPPTDNRYVEFQEYNSPQTFSVSPDLVVPAIGFRSTLDELSDGRIKLSDFYLGCCHVEHKNLLLVGFARPIIGNIPTISEMQARYACALLGGRIQPDRDIQQQHRKQVASRDARFSQLNLDAIYAVEMFPYCDQLARRLGVYPSTRSLGSPWAWLRAQLSPATTMHYYPISDRISHSAPIYMPGLLVMLLLLLKPIDALYRTGLWLVRRLSGN